jgi:hypothetical protein
LKQACEEFWTGDGTLSRSGWRLLAGAFLACVHKAQKNELTPLDYSPHPFTLGFQAFSPENFR